MKHTLLLADDSVTIQRVIELTFADEDIQVVAVSDGDQAIACLEASPPDIVLADIGMPGRNGYQVAQYIRQTPHLTHIPVVLLTGAFEPVDQERAAEAGCDGVLAKPFEPQLVISRVKELLARPRHLSPALDNELPPQPSGAAEQPVPSLDDSLMAPPIEPAPTGELNDYFDRLDAAFATLSTAAPASESVTPASATDAPQTAPEIDWYGRQDSAVPVTDHWDLPTEPEHKTATDDLPLSYSAPAPATPASPSIIVAEVIVADVTRAPDEVVEHSTPVEAVDTVAAFEIPAPVEGFEPMAPAEAAEMPAPADRPIEHATLTAEPVPVAVSEPAKAASLPPKPATLPTLADAFAALLASEQGTPLPATAPGWPATAPPPMAITDALLEDVTRRVIDRLSDQVVRETVSDIVSKVAERMVAEEIARIKAAIT